MNSFSFRWTTATATTIRMVQKREKTAIIVVANTLVRNDGLVTILRNFLLTLYDMFSELCSETCCLHKWICTTLLHICNVSYCGYLLTLLTGIKKNWDKSIHFSKSFWAFFDRYEYTIRYTEDILLFKFYCCTLICISAFFPGFIWWWISRSFVVG